MEARLLRDVYDDLVRVEDGLLSMSIIARGDDRCCAIRRYARDRCSC
jgi:hypothetical protein